MVLFNSYVKSPEGNYHYYQYNLVSNDTKKYSNYKKSMKLIW